MVGGDKPATISRLGQFKLPEDKNLAEITVMERLCRLQTPIDSFLKFPNDHGPDFILKMKDGTAAFAELFEIAIISSGGYEKTKRLFTVGEFIDHVVKKLLEKDEKYSKREFRPLHIVIYVSDDRFVPGPYETQALRAAINILKLASIQSVTLVLFAHDGSPFAIAMYPFQKELHRNELRRRRSHQMVRPDFSRAKIIKDNSRPGFTDVTVRIYMPEDYDFTGYVVDDKKPISSTSPAAEIARMLQVKKRDDDLG
jgi:hypothetical protein